MCLIDSSIHDSPTIFSPSLACKLRGEKNCNHNKELRAWRSIIILGDTEQSWKEPCMIVMCHDRWMRIGSDKLRFPARSLYLCWRNQQDDAAAADDDVSLCVSSELKSTALLLTSFLQARSYAVDGQCTKSSQAIAYGLIGRNTRDYATNAQNTQATSRSRRCRGCEQARGYPHHRWL